VARWYPGGVQPRTAPVVFVPICEGNPGQSAAPEGGTFRAPLLVQFYCATQGASMAYTYEEGEDVRWRLYTAPLRLPPGETTIRARAIRIGYGESEERVATFRMT
jgi:N-sulfoglucosamine sulfohydrolase